MRLWTPAWRASVRIARRDALRRGSRGRTALIASMIGLPVAVISGLAVFAATMDVAPAETMNSQLGSAVAMIRADGGEPIVQTDDGTNAMPLDPEALAPTGIPLTAAEIQAATGGRLIPLGSASTVVSVDAGKARVDAIELDLRDPVAGRTVHLARGVLPSTPDEVAVTRDVSSRGPDVGDVLRVGNDERPMTVTAVVDSRDYRRGIFALPGALSEDSGSAVEALRSPRYLLDRATPVTWEEVQRLNRLGLVVTSRAVLESPPPADQLYANYAGMVQGDSSWDPVMVIFVLAIVLEVVLLAGPSFAVGVRRQRRQLALVAACGGSSQQVARIVRAQALVIGLGSAVGGAALGVLAVVALILWLQRADPYAVGVLDVRWWQIAVVVALGAGSALIAAWVPSRQAARTDVVLELAGRRAPARRRSAHVLLGAGLLAAGLLLAWRAMAPGGEFLAAWSTILLVLAGIALLPWVVAGVARAGRRLPLPLRLATRDADRHRSRTTPAVAAIMGSVAALTALAIGGFSDIAESRETYSPRLAGQGTLVEAWNLDQDAWSAAQQRAQAVLPGAQLQPAGQLTGASGGGPENTTIYVPTPGCPDVATERTRDDACGQTWYVPETSAGTGSFAESLVADADTIEALGWPLDEDQRAVLLGGGVLVPRADSITDGTTTLTVTTSMSADERPEDRPTHSATVRAAVAPYRLVGGVAEATGVILTPETAEALGFGWHRNQALVTGIGDLSAEQTRVLEEALTAVTPEISVYTERGFVDDLTLPIFGVLAGAGILLVLIGTFTATGLALADSRADLSTLAAVGAAPRLRRAVAASQSLVIALVGTVTGLAIGFVPGIAVTWPLTSGPGPGGITVDGSGQESGETIGPFLDIPWALLGIIVLVVPLLAATVTALVTRSKLPLVRRLAQ